jgi:hypothetical protein
MTITHQETNKPTNQQTNKPNKIWIKQDLDQIRFTFVVMFVALGVWVVNHFIGSQFAKANFFDLVQHESSKT